ncbi:hypothetical protein EPA93_26890 [Ktedonosporobacter rubrisoli]|uniref:Uncharacterized protein n=1 Tax=Ktedonosporobacter rubrisoli TaxID=2509675 RepID=A0A4P6JUU3_KTERU|nr:hypothetical protein [Ktedonosporobacter rubrisoli]QBD79417.1 hypothetical protein EPA93_26890 [Ktedonosporobacter rubrisoli]
MKAIRATLRKPGYLTLTIVLTVVFLALYIFFDLREGGRTANLLTTHIRPPDFYLQHFGALYFFSCLILDILTSFASAVLISLSIDHYRQGSSMFTGSACSAGAVVILGISTFGCPSCVLPLVGTFGAVFFAKAMPLFGVEFKLLSVVILALTFYWLLRRLKNAEPPVMIEQASATPN